jgi:hypothetical protein
MNNSFEIKIDGSGVTPQTVRARDILELVVSLETAIASAAEHFVSHNISDAGLELHLSDIGDGVARYQLSTGELGYRAASRCTRAIAENDLSWLPPRARDGILAIAAKSRSHNWTIRISDGDGMQAATIRPETEFAVKPRLSGFTNTQAYVVRVGGMKPSAQLQLADGRQITASIANQELATRLSGYLYKTVSVDGQATWTGDDLALTELQITDIGTFDDAADIVDTLRHLASIAGGHWDHVDAEEYIREMRSE